MYAVLALALLIQPPDPPKKKDYHAIRRETVIKEYGLQPDANDSPLRKLQKERCFARAVALTMIKEIIDINLWRAADFDDYIKLHVKLFENLAELSDKPADKVKWYEMRVEKLKEIENFILKRVKEGSQPPQDEHIAKATRIEAELELLKLKESLKGGK